MALDLTPRKIRERIQADLDLRRDTTRRSADLIRQYAEGSRESWASDEPTFENHCFEWITNVVPHKVFTNPSCRVSDMGARTPEVEAIEMALRSLVVQTRLNLDLTAVAVDEEFDFGVGMVYTEPVRDLIDPMTGQPVQNPQFTPMRPRFRRLSPRQVFRDSRMPEFGKCRQEGHIFVKDYDEMLAETEMDEGGNLVKKYDAAALEALTQNDGLDELREDLMQDGMDLSANDNLVIGFEVFVPDENGTGMWVTLGFTAGDDATFLRAEREYRGPKGGPYCWFGTYLVPDQVYPLANLAVTRRQVEEINKHRWQGARDAGTAKQIGVVNGAAPGVVANIQDAKSGDILSLPGFSGVLNTMKFGGAMPETMEYIEFSKGQLDRLSGLTEMQRGNVTGVTATESDQAAKFVDVRLHFMQNRFKEDVSAMLGKVAEVLGGDSNVAFPITVANGDTADGQGQQGTFFGGWQPPRTPQEMQARQMYPWKPSLTVQIEPYSMEYTNASKLREEAIEFQAQVLQVVQAQMAMGPALNGRAMVNDLGQTMNMPRAGDRYVNWQALMQQIQMAALQQQAAAQMGMQQQAQEVAAGPKRPSPKPSKQPAGAGA